MLNQDSNQLIIQAFIQHQWIDMACIEFDDDKKIIAFTYVHEHALTHFLADNHFATSINYPVELFSYQVTDNWLAFLDDMIPAGASKRYWLKKLDLSRFTEAEQTYQLLKIATIAPVGHLRIKEAVTDYTTPQKPKLFTVSEVINRDVDFLEYANEHGAIAGGATGAGGEAPKLLLRYRDDDAIWIDNQQTIANNDDYYLVKYPRGKRSEIDCDILRAEFYYYHELTDMGYDTIDVMKMKLLEGKRYPSLWLPRFDVYQNEQGTHRYAMESVYSMLQKGVGAYLDHEQTIRQLIAKIKGSQMMAEGIEFDEHDFVIEWVRRDLLNIIFGNSDNHGRNTAFLRDDEKIVLAPIYDFAPMKADPEGIVRTIKWNTKQKLESGGDYRFDLIADKLADIVAPEILLTELEKTATQLLGLKDRLVAKGVPVAIIDFPTINFETVEQKLQKWGVLT